MVLVMMRLMPEEKGVDAAHFGPGAAFSTLWKDTSLDCFARMKVTLWTNFASTDGDVL
jgi:hypothetical protein